MLYSQSSNIDPSMLKFKTHFLSAYLVEGRVLLDLPLHSRPHKAQGTANVEPGRFLGHALPPGRALLRMGLPEGSPAFLPSLIRVLVPHMPRQGLAPGQGTSRPATSGLFENHGHGAVLPKLLLLFGRGAPAATAPPARPGWGTHSSPFLCPIANYTDSDRYYPKGGS